MAAERPVASVGGRADPQSCYAYFYLMKADPDAVRVVAPRHASYWRELRLSHYVGGPFEDRTGGLITFDAADATEAERAVRGDPFLLQELVEAHWIKRWARETPIGAPTAHHARRPLLGLRRKPGRLALAFLRMPRNANRHHAGSVLGHTFLEFTHTGRKTGRPYDAVAMVLHYDEATREAVIFAAWGPETDWVRNLRAGPPVKVQLGRESFKPEHRFLSEEEAFDVLVQFRREHPHRVRLSTTIMGWGDLRDNAVARDFIRAHPFVAFRPMASPSP
jgi:deazaflavin-dependent oxidoreductase (nitroreductase family)